MTDLHSLKPLEDLLSFRNNFLHLVNSSLSSFFISSSVSTSSSANSTYGKGFHPKIFNQPQRQKALKCFAKTPHANFIYSDVEMGFHGKSQPNAQKQASPQKAQGCDPKNGLWALIKEIFCQGRVIYGTMTSLHTQLRDCFRRTALFKMALADPAENRSFFWTDHERTHLIFCTHIYC